MNYNLIFVISIFILVLLNFLIESYYKTPKLYQMLNFHLKI